MWFEKLWRKWVSDKNKEEGVLKFYVKVLKYGIERKQNSFNWQGCLSGADLENIETGAFEKDDSVIAKSWIGLISMGLMKSKVLLRLDVRDNIKEVIAT